MSKFKVGDKVKRVDKFGLNFNRDTLYIVTFISDEYLAVDGIIGRWSLKYFDLANIWNIYNNTKPLSELSDEQLSQMVNWLRKGLSAQYLHNCEWADRPASNSLININSTYRAKQKSERELFIDAAMSYYGSDNMSVCTIEMLEAMFDAGFKAPMVGE